MPEPFGFVNAFKPPGPSSTSFGTWVRRQFGRRISGGHWGTLDPAACGVLVIAIGEATKLLPYLGEGRKQYAFELVAGARTSTADAGGAVIAAMPVPGDWARRLADALPSFLGDQEQTPPMFSAVKVDGRPLYRSARRGEDVPRSARRVRVHALDLLRVEGGRAFLRVTCSAGTYVRVLCERIAEAAGTGGHMGMLVRTGAGPFALSDACLPQILAARPHACLIDPRSVVAHPVVAVAPDDARRFSHGNPIQAHAAGPGFAGLPTDAPDRGVVIVESSGTLLGVANVTGDGAHRRLVPLRVFVGSEGAAAGEANGRGA